MQEISPIKRIIHFALLILLLNGCFLFSPKPTIDTEFWGEYIPLNTYAGFILNYDSNEFIESAISPTALLRENYVRQNRPLYVIVASSIGYSIYYISSPFKSIFELTLKKSLYAGYVFLNFIILLLALYIFEKLARILTDGNISYATTLMLCVFIASNFMTKAFFWTAHQQMFAFLIPLLGIYISIKWLNVVPTKSLYVYFFLFGLGMLTYGSFLILFVSSLFYVCYRLYVNKKLVANHSFLFIFISCMLFLIPTVFWILFLKYKGIVYYNHEVVRYRQLVWIIDTLSVSAVDFLTTFYSNLMQFFITFSKLYLFIAVIGVAVIIRKIKMGSAFLFDRNTKLILLQLAFFTAFFMLLGYYAYRLTFTLMPILLCLSIAQAGELLNTKKIQLVIFITVCAWHAYTVFSYGPFS